MLRTLSFSLSSGLSVRRQCLAARDDAFERLGSQLDHQRGALFSCGVEAPGRYRPYQVGMVNPPLVVTVSQRHLTIESLNKRGDILLPLSAALLGVAYGGGRQIQCRAPAPGPYQGAEELRTRRPSVFSLLRRLMTGLAMPQEPYLGLYGAFGYDLAFALEDIAHHHPRALDQRDLVLYLPDRLLLQPTGGGPVYDLRYEFGYGGKNSDGLARDGAYLPGSDSNSQALRADHGQGAYAAQVDKAKQFFARGDLFELVLSQTLARPQQAPPSTLYRRLIAANPAPYQALISLGQGEHLVAASPEMFVRVTSGNGAGAAKRVETCPISGTIARGTTALEDAEAITTLLNSAKDHAELTMCTDVDRNDKARVCLPGSVQVIGRRQIELYSRLIHTVDHVVGTLRPDMDALDAFLTHTWAVTVTGAPKLHAMRHVEAMEQGPRHWYGGAFGALRFDGSMDTGLTLRTVRLKDGVAEVRVGATLLHDSDPQAEQDECLLKASAMMAVLDQQAPVVEAARPVPGQGKRVLLVDHEDSFVLTLADYLRQTGADVLTLRPQAALAHLAQQTAIDLVVLSPGPGRPEDFAVADTLAASLKRGLPVFGVCLGLQGIVEAFGGSLRQLETPVHGKASAVHHHGEGIFGGLPSPLMVGRYHSLVADQMPADLQVTARSEDGLVMAVVHRTLPIAAVQFHPESLLSAGQGVGLDLLRAVVGQMALPRQQSAA
jgi:anthranilate synthase